MLHLVDDLMLCSWPGDLFHELEDCDRGGGIERRFPVTEVAPDVGGPLCRELDLGVDADPAILVRRYVVGMVALLVVAVGRPGRVVFWSTAAMRVDCALGGAAAWMWAK